MKFDRFRPPDMDPPPKTRRCPECRGTGIVLTSACCGADIVDKDGYVCSECGLEAEPTTCQTCDGDGEIYVDELC